MVREHKSGSRLLVDVVLPKVLTHLEASIDRDLAFTLLFLINYHHFRNYRLYYQRHLELLAPGVAPLLTYGVKHITQMFEAEMSACGRTNVFFTFIFEVNPFVVDKVLSLLGLLAVRVAMG